MTRTCFILDELYPKDRGGIARLMHNIIHHAKSLDGRLELHVVLASEKPPGAALEEAFAGVARLHHLRPGPRVAARFGGKNLALHAVFPRQAEPARRELQLLDAVLEAEEAHGPFDHIEIPDHMGLGAGLLQARQAGLAFERAEITCRIHSALSVIIEAEPFYHPRSDWLAPRLEMERFALGQADRVVAHLPTIARYNQAHFSFPPQWGQKVETAFPPVIWPPQPQAAPAAPAPPAEASGESPPERDFIFTSRFQPFKRPELFIKAAITMLDGGSDYAGTFRLISYGFNPEYIDSLRLLIPARHHKRILVQTNVSPQARLAAMAGGVVVQPSKYESLCALAYEAATMGCPLLLARDCHAFADDPHWQDGKNCLLFSPTPEGLAEAMEKARDWQPLAGVDTTPAPPYFLHPPRRRAAPAAPATGADIALLAGPVQTPADTARLGAHFESQHAATPPKVHIFGYGAQQPARPNLAYHAFSEGGVAARQWHDLAESLCEEAIILFAPHALPLPAFIAEGRRVVRPGLAYSANGLNARSGQMLVYPGKFATMTRAEPRLCPQCIMLHREDLFFLLTDDDEALLPRALTRLAQSDIGLALSPAPHVLEHNPDMAPPLQRQLGYEAAPLWAGGFRWVGLATRPSQNTPLLQRRETTLTLHTKTPLGCTQGQPVLLDAAPTPRALALDIGDNVENSIFCLHVSNDDPENAVEVSLQQAFGAKPLEAALTLHEKGRNRRALAGGQGYIMRWGPIRHSQKLVLVISAKKPLKLRLADPFITSRA